MAYRLRYEPSVVRLLGRSVLFFLRQFLGREKKIRRAPLATKRAVSVRGDLSVFFFFLRRRTPEARGERETKKKRPWLGGVFFWYEWCRHWTERCANATMPFGVPHASDVPERGCAFKR